jgi:hypothetical protein
MIENIIKEKTVYDEVWHGYRFVATYLKEPAGDALIEIFKGDKLKKEFLFPSYKIYNIAAHAQDIAVGLDKESDEGLRVAGSNGLGGNCFSS